MKRNLKIFSIIIPSLIALFTLGNKALEFYNNLTAELAQKTEQLIDTHMTINRYENELGETVIEKEKCETTQEIVIAKKEKEIKRANENISEYEDILDSVVNESIRNEHKAEIKAVEVPSIVINQLTLRSSGIVQKEIKAVKSFKTELFLIERNDKKRLLKRIFAKLRK